MDQNELSDNFKSTVASRRWIVRLLALCVLVALTLYLSWTPEERLNLKSASQIDEMIRETIERYPVPPTRVQTQTVAIDSVTSRRVYTLSVPPEFSKAQWHYELDKTVRPWRISTPARVIFPERNLRIHLVYNKNVIRTIDLRTISGTE